MMIKKYGIVFSFLMMSLLGVSQTKRPSIVVHDMDKLAVFEELVELLIDSEYFIQNLEKDAGFIQVKYIVKGKGLFNKDDGNKVIYNLLLKTTRDNDVMICLQANVEDRDWNGNATGSVHYYTDNGISDNLKDYKELLTLIESHFENQ